MARRIKSGIDLLEDVEGEGRPAERGDNVMFHLRLYLNKGDEVPINESVIARGLTPDYYSVIDGRQLIDRRILLGRRQAIAGIEHSLVGMRVGGYRKVKISPHLAYRDQGVPNLIPENAVLLAEIWLREIRPPGTAQPS